MKNARKLIGLFAFATIALAAPFAFATEGVSPGAGDRLAVIQDGCPAFSWGEVDGAAFYEVVAYRLPEGEDFVVSAGVELSKENEVLYTRVAGAATAWTPSLERCFVSGGSYVWFVRAVFDEDGTPAAGDWSEGLFFSVATAPSAAEVRQALGVLQRYLEEGGGGNEELAAVFSGTGTGSGSGAIGTTRNAGTIKVAGRALPGTAAIRGEQPDPTGETLGVYGISNSSTDGSIGVAGESTAATGETYGVGGITASVDGAGVIAFNSANGTDLILGADTSSAHLTELGITRSVPGPATFDIGNPDGAGTMTLHVDGVDVVTTATDQDALGGLSCASGEVAKWNGSQWACDDDLDTDTDTLAALSCGLGELAKWNGSQWACGDDLDTDTLGGLTCANGELAKWNGSAWGCAPYLDPDALGLRGSRVWLLPYWIRHPRGRDVLVEVYTEVWVTYLGDLPQTTASCYWFVGNTPLLEELDVAVWAGNPHSFHNGYYVDAIYQGWFVVESDEPVFAEAKITRTVEDNVQGAGIGLQHNPGMIPIDCSSPQGYEFVCAQLAE